MNIKSTVEFKSNLQLAKKNIPLSEDREFYENIIDPFAIGKLKKYRPHDLTELQRQIYDKAGIHCMYADEGDYPWGVIRDGDKARVVCKCLKKECELFSLCRPEFNNTDIDFLVNNIDEKVLKNNTRLTQIKEIDVSFEQYCAYSPEDKMKSLLTYWDLSSGSFVKLLYDDSENAYLINENGQILINPFTKEPIIIKNASIYKFSHLVFDIIEPCSDKDSLIYYVRSARKGECKVYAAELLHEYKLSRNSDLIESDKKKRRKTASEIKAKHGFVKDEKYCRHAGCYELAVRDGYCSEHIRYQKAESK